MNSKIALFLLIALVAVLALLRLHTFDEPLERDLTIYAVIGHELAAGRTLYSDLWDHKPPAVYYSYALADKIFGYGPQEIFALNLIVSIASLLAIYFAGKAYRNNWIGGLIAASLWVVLSEDLVLEANQPNVEAFMNMCLATCFALVVWAGPRLGTYRMLCVGALAALASLYKQVGVIPIMAVCAANVFLPTSNVAVSVYSGQNEIKAKRSWLEFVGVAGICVAIWGVIAMLFAVTRHWRDFYGALFTYNRFYAGDLGSNLFDGLSLLNSTKDIRLAPLDPFFLISTLSIAGLILGLTLGLVLKDKFARLWLLWLAYAIGAYIAVILPGRLHPHYFQLLLPVLAIGASWSLITLHRAIRIITSKAVYAESYSKKGVGQFFRKCKNYWKKELNFVLPLITGLLVLLPLSVYELKNINKPAVQWSASQHGSIFIADKHIGEKIKTLLHPNESLYVWGSDTGIYFYSQRHPAAGTFFNFHLTGGPLAEKLSIRTIAQFALNPPELAVIALTPEQAQQVQPGLEGQVLSAQQINTPGLSTLNKILSQNRVTNWFLANRYSFFTVLEAEHNYYALLVRPYGSLAARIGA